MKTRIVLTVVMITFLSLGQATEAFAVCSGGIQAGTCVTGTTNGLCATDGCTPCWMILGLKRRRNRSSW